MRNIADIIRALRCQNLPGNHRIGDGCPYYITATEEEIDSFCREFGADKSELPAGFCDGCDVDKTYMDAIKALEKDLETKPRWIPVDEKLPEEGVPVLVHGAGGENGFAIQTQWDGEWTVEWGGVWHPTHWMPLPEPPKGGNDNGKND